VKKEFTSVVVLLAGAFVAHSQAVVSFANYYALSRYIYVSLGTTLLGGTNAVTTGNPKLDVGNGNDWTVALWGAAGVGDSSATLEANGNLATATLENGTGDSTPGTWLSTITAVIPGTRDGEAVSIQLASWYNDGGAVTSYAAAQAAGYPIGLSAVATGSTAGPVGGGSGPPETAPNLPSGLGNIVLAFPPPRLTLTTLSTNALITWPTNFGGFTLESTTNLLPGAWGAVSPAPVVVNGQFTVTNPISGSQRFYQLRQ
jgi:hypothetical protein